MGARAIFVGYAKTLGLDVDRFKKDIDSEEVKARINLDHERGASIGVDRTPILFVDTFQIPFASFNLEGLHAAIDAVLAGKPPPPPLQSPTPAQPQSPTPAQPK